MSSVQVTSFNGRVGDVSLIPSDIQSAGGALAISPALSGIPTAPTAAIGTNTTQIATTAYVAAAVATGVAGVGSFNGRIGAVTLQTADVSGVGGALLASPAFTGTPTAPTAATSTNTTQVATTAFVQTALANYSLPVATTTIVGGVKQGANVTIAGDGTLSVAAPYSLPVATTGAVGGVSIGSGLNITPQGLLSAVVTSPYTLPQATTTVLGGVTVGSGLAVNSGNLTLSLPAATTNTIGGVLIGSNISVSGNGTISVAPPYSLTPATTSVLGGVIVGSGLSVNGSGVLSITTGGSSAVVNSFNSRTGAVTLVQSDITNAGGAILASPSFSGTPTSTTPTAGDNSANIATTAFVQNANKGVLALTITGNTTLTNAQAYSGGIITLAGTLTAATTFTFPANVTGVWKIMLVGLSGISGTNSLTIQSATTGATAIYVITTTPTVGGASITITSGGVYNV
jgi:hypothetical protein